MMLTLVRRDEALRKLPVWGVVLVLNAIFLLGFLSYRAFGQRSAVPATTIALLGFATVAVHVAVGSGRSRTTDLHLALPIPARRLWLAHVAAVFVGGLVLIGAYLGAAALQANVARTRAPLDADLGQLALLLGAATLLATALLQIPRPSLARIPLSAGYVAWACAVFSATIGSVMALAGRGPLGGVALLALAGIATVAGYRRVPAAFALAPREAAAPTTSVAEEAGAEFRRARAAVGLVTWPRFFLDAKGLVAYPLVALVGVFLAGAFDARASDADLRDIRYAYIPMGAYMLFTLVAPGLSRLHHLDPLPLPRRILAAGVLLPTAAAFLLSFAAGAAAARYGPRTEYVDFRQESGEGKWTVTVPLRAYRVAWDGRAPAIESPWGESHAAESLRPFPAGRAVIWNPFSAPPGSTASFVSLQISRAAEAVYGASIPPEEIERRWIRTLPDGSVAGVHGSLPLRAERPDLSPRSGPTIPVLLAVVLVPWLLLVSAVFRAFRAGVAPWVRLASFWGVVVLFLLTMLGEAVALIGGFARPWLPRALVEIPSFALEASAGLAALVWAVAAVLVLGAYSLAESQFLRMEIPTRPTKFSLVELCRRED